MSITCKQLQQIIEMDASFVLYFGKYENLRPDRYMSHFAQAQVFTKSYFTQRFMFATLDYTRHPECLGQFLLPAEREDAIAIYHGKQFNPFIRAINPKAAFEHFMQLIQWICMVKSEMFGNYGECTQLMLLSFKFSSLILVNSREPVESVQWGWLEQNIFKAMEDAKANLIFLVPVIGPLNNPALSMQMVQLSTILGGLEDSEKFPRLFLYHGASGRSFEFAFDLTKQGEQNNDVTISAWAQIIVMEAEIVSLASKLESETTREGRDKIVKNLRTLRADI